MRISFFFLLEKYPFIHSHPYYHFSFIKNPPIFPMTLEILVPMQLLLNLKCDGLYQWMGFI